MKLTIEVESMTAQQKAIEKFTKAFEKESLRHSTAMAALQDWYLESFAAYRRGFQFTFEGDICTILEVRISQGSDWRNKEWGGNPDFNPDQDISYIVDEPSWRYGEDQSKMLWRQDVMKRRISELIVSKEED